MAEAMNGGARGGQGGGVENRQRSPQWPVEGATRALVKEEVGVPRWMG